MEIKVNEQFSIILDSNPTTGYAWEAAFDSALIRLKSKSFEQSVSGALGAGGKEKFTFVPLKAGETKIHMSYKRPWESKSAQEKSIEVMISESPDE